MNTKHRILLTTVIFAASLGFASVIIASDAKVAVTYMLSKDSKKPAFIGFKNLITKKKYYTKGRHMVAQISRGKYGFGLRKGLFGGNVACGILIIKQDITITAHYSAKKKSCHLSTRWVKKSRRRLSPKR